MAKYSQSDLDQLAKMKLSLETSPIGHRSAAAGSSVGQTVTYAVGDLENLGRLMSFGGPAKMAVRADRAPSEVGGQESLYSPADLARFERIAIAVPFAKDMVESDGDGPIASAKYSKQDVEAFAVLMQLDHTAAFETEAPAPVRQAPVYAAAAPRQEFVRPRTIKVVETDKERAREERGYLEGKGKIKIVYSDAIGRRY